MPCPACIRYHDVKERSAPLFWKTVADREIVFLAVRTHIDRITVKDDRLDAVISLDTRILQVTNVAAEKLLALFPGLADQVCLGGKGDRFGLEITGTETGHLIEHLTIELMLRERDLCSHVAPLIMSGHTKQRGAQAEVTVSFEDDLVAMGALKAAVSLLPWAFEPEHDEPDIENLVTSIHALRGR